MGYYLTDKQLDEVLSKMFEAIGREFISVNKSCGHPGWYMRFSWTEAEENKFKEWLVSYLVKNVGHPIGLAKKKAAMFCFMFGWRYRRENKPKARKGRTP